MFKLTLSSNRDNWGGDSYRARDRDRDRDRDDYRPPVQHAGPSFVSSLHNEFEYTSPDEAIDIFVKTLQGAGIQPDWTWEQAMRATISDPRYRAVKDPRVRKATFDDFISEVRTKEKEKEKERQAKARADFTTMLKRHHEIRYYSRWKTVRPMIEGEAMFRSARDEDERTELFNEYKTQLYKEYVSNQIQDRKAAEEELRDLFESLELQPYTRWAEAREALESNATFQSDAKFRSLYPNDILKAWETHMKQLENTFNDKVKGQRALKIRKSRKNRDAFKQLLYDLKTAGKTKPGTKWSQIHPLIEDDPRYDAMLGQQGSTPLDLFFDMLEDEEYILKPKRADAMHALEVRSSSRFLMVRRV